MTRPPRLQYRNALYHVFSRGNDKQTLFADHEDGQLFLKFLSIAAERHELRVFAYCIMGTHYHLLVETPRANIAAGMHQLLSLYAHAFNQKYEKCGHAFQSRYTSFPIEKDSYLFEVIRYILLNPVHAGVSSDPADWPFSSYRATVGREQSPDFLDVPGLLGFFGLDMESGLENLVEHVKNGIGKAPLLDFGGKTLRPTLEEIFRSRPLMEAISSAVNDFGYRHQQVADHTGYSRSQVSRISAMHHL
ncbi:MAG: transposase [Candidatus Geothermincolia bacterium]